MEDQAQNRPRGGSALRRTVAALAGIAPLRRAHNESAISVGIDYRDALSYEEFAKKYLYPLKPVVIRGVLDKWSAIGRLDSRSFSSKNSAI